MRAGSCLGESSFHLVLVKHWHPLLQFVNQRARDPWWPEAALWDLALDMLQWQARRLGESTPKA